MLFGRTGRCHCLKHGFCVGKSSSPNSRLIVTGIKLFGICVVGYSLMLKLLVDDAE